MKQAAIRAQAAEPLMVLHFSDMSVEIKRTARRYIPENKMLRNFFQFLR
jgi:hypothetical protein